MTSYERTAEHRKRMSDRKRGIRPVMPEGWSNAIRTSMSASWERRIGPRPTCACGCGQYPKTRARKYVTGHVPWGKHLKGKVGWKKGLTTPENVKAKISSALKGTKLTNQHKENITEAMRRPDVQKKLRCQKPSLRGNTHNREALRNGRMRIRPTSLEKNLMALLDRWFPGEWMYVGDGRVAIGYKIPDFMNCNGKKALIEAFGEYWHEPKDEGIRQEHFSKYGFSTLVVWGKELGNEKRLKGKLQRFLSSLRG